MVMITPIKVISRVYVLCCLYKLSAPPQLSPEGREWYDVLIFYLFTSLSALVFMLSYFMLLSFSLFSTYQIFEQFLLAE
jgi:hypothetical protein